MSALRPSYALLAGDAPKAAKKYMPWADAVVAVGMSIYPDDWDHAERALSDYTIVDRHAEITAISKAERPDMAMRAQYSAAMARVDGLGQGRGRWSDPKSEAIRKQNEEPLVREVEAVRQEISDRLPDLASLKMQNDQRKAKLKRAVEELADALMDGVSAYWYREGSTSPPVDLPTGQIMAARAGDGFNLFVRGRIRSSGSQHHVYVDAEQLAKAFPRLSDPLQSVGTFQIDALSPYLQLMIQVSLEQGVTAQTRTTPEALGDILRTEAPKFGLTAGKGNDGSDITKTWSTQLGKALRWPDARKGRAEPGSTRKR